MPTERPYDRAPILEWLAESSLKGDPVEVLLAGFCERLNAAGFGVRRGHVSAATVHPAVNAQSVTWVRGRGTTNSTFAHGETIGAGWLVSPFRYMLHERLPTLRRRLVGPAANLDFPILREMQADGMTDWIGQLISFGWSAAHIEGGEMGVITSWASDNPQGFSDAQLDELRRLLNGLGAAIKMATLDGIAHNVLAAYVGRDAAERVLTGAITRGTVQRLRAVLFFADLRGFTQLSATLPTEEVVALLNDVFDRVAGPIAARGGEILKFIGDGLLAVFLIDDRHPQAAAADAALAAALEVQQALAAAPAKLALDIALHLGEVHYGNIGAADRLDFTVIGSAVNEVARLEELCSRLDEPILVSGALRDAAVSMGGKLVSRGQHVLRGIAEPRAIYALPVP